MMTTILQLGVSISVLTNCMTLFKLMKALKENDHLAGRLASLEWALMDLTLTRKSYGDRVQGVAEDTKVV